MHYALTLLALVLSDPAELPAVVVDVEEAPPAETALGTGVASVLSPDEVAASGETLADVVAETPGVHLRRAGVLGAYSALSIRGLPAANVAVVLDDVQLSSASLGSADLSLIPVGDIERVEIYRGAGPVRYDSPMGGLVRVVTRPPGKEWKSAAQASYGAWSTLGLLAMARGTTGPLRLALSLGYDGTAGDFPYYDDRATLGTVEDDVVRRRQNNHYQQGHGRLAAELDGPRHSTLALRLNVRQQEQGIAGSGVASTEQAHAGEREGVLRLSLDGAQLARSRIIASIGLDALVARRAFADPRREVGLQVGDVTTRLSRFGADARLQVLSSATRETELSPRVSRETLRQRGASNVAGERDLERDRTQLAVGVEHRVDVSSRLRLVAGARLERVTDSGPRLDSRSEQAASPRLGVLLAAKPCELRANAGRYHRFPTTLERFGDGVTSTTNPDLDAERGQSADVGMTCTGTPGERLELLVHGATFVTRAVGLIVLMPSSQFFLRAENLGRTDITGAELAGRLRHAFAGADAVYTLTRARDDSDVLGFDGKQAPGIPTHRATAGVELGPRALSLRYELSYASATQLNRPNLQPAPARLLHDLSACGTWEPLALEARLAVTNLTDVTHQEAPLGDASNATGVAGVRDFTGYPLPGRGWSFTLIWRQT